MIFVTVGTGQFDLLIKEIDRLAPNLNHDVIAQIGKGEYIPKNISYFRFKKSIQEEYKKADIIIAHAGAGTTYEILPLNKKLISVANLQRTDNHQLDIVKKLSREKYLLWCKNIHHIHKCINDIKNIRFKKYFPPKNGIAAIIKKYIDNQR